ncbi:MAG: hypothetical protein IJZ21_03550 [Clostridia bacterium]|nr:hypothetical protein [Clostridia bacterium]
MANKKESDTLRQRKFAQQEFLKLKKMQQGVLDSGPKPSEVYSAPLTFSEKLKNIWYHDKWAIVVVAAMAVCIVLLVAQCATKTQYDATVVVFTYTMTGDNNCEKIGEYLKPYCKDINSDGEINLNVINCSIEESQGNTEHSYTARTKASTLIASEASALLFITDDESYKYLSSLSEEIDLFEGEPIEFREDFYEFCKDAELFYPTPDGLQISCRTIEGTVIANDKNINTYYDQAKTILDGLKEKYAE